MIRFLLNFIFFGLLFYVIYRFLPDTFAILVNWIEVIFDFLANVVMWIVEQVQAATSSKR